VTYLPSSHRVAQFRGLRAATSIAALWFLAGLAPLNAQTGPRIGYVYPAGGRAGTTFQVNVGGQAIESVTNVIAFTGEGISAVLVDVHKPMQQGVFNRFRDQLRELQSKQQAYAKAVRQGRPKSCCGKFVRRSPRTRPTGTPPRRSPRW
jgi:hypothetical protein